jgi:hypothetical protein
MSENRGRPRRVLFLLLGLVMLGATVVFLFNRFGRAERGVPAGDSAGTAADAASPAAA